MAAAKSHPHLEMPSEQQLGEVIEDLSPAHRDLYLELHRLVLASVPDIRFSVDLADGAIGYGARQFGYDGWGMAALTPHANWVSLVFLRGADLDDQAGLLEGSGALVRHVKLRSVEQLANQRGALQGLVESAAAVTGVAASDEERRGGDRT